MSVPTSEQQAIINDQASCVVIAKPGSGKTYTLARKIQSVLSILPYYRGVIAISFTNKASDELRNRSLAGGIDKQGSFFGTIDRFFLTELVFPFMRHKFGAPKADPKTVKLSQIEDPQVREEVGAIVKGQNPTLDQHAIGVLRQLYLNGQIVLETVGHLGNYLFDESRVLRSYLKAKYSHIIVDEYQDSGLQQHRFFLKCQSLGLIAIAMGDLDQSIYAFAGKSSTFLFQLTQHKSFQKYALLKNHRCHPSIANYSLKLINPEFNIQDSGDARIYLKELNGTEIDLAKWIEVAIPKLIAKFEVKKRSHIAVLARGHRTLGLIASNLSVPHKLIEDNQLDSDSSLRGGIYRRILNCIFDKEQNAVEMIEEYLGSENNRLVASNILNVILSLRSAASESSENLNESHFGLIKNCADQLSPLSENVDADHLLLTVLSDRRALQTYIPARQDEVQLLTLHKSKGLEFDVVFHLDLHQFIIPSYGAIVDRDKEELTQSLNLHYVGLTRSKKACVLCVNRKRHKDPRTVVEGKPSEFLNRPGLASLRKAV